MLSNLRSINAVVSCRRETSRVLPIGSFHSAELLPMFSFVDTFIPRPNGRVMVESSAADVLHFNVRESAHRFGRSSGRESSVRRNRGDRRLPVQPHLKMMPTIPPRWQSAPLAGLHTSGGADSLARCGAEVAWDIMPVTLAEIPNLIATSTATSRICPSCVSPGPTLSA